MAQEQQVSVVQRTKIGEAVFVVTLMIGAFAVGMSMLIAASNFTKITFGPIPGETVSLNTPMKIFDVTGISIAGEPVGFEVASEADAMTIKGGTNSNAVTFATITGFDEFTDGQSVATPLPVSITLNANSHRAYMLTFQTGVYAQTGTPSCFDTDPKQYPGYAGQVGGADENGETFLYDDVCTTGTADGLTEYRCVDNPGGDGLVPEAVTSTCPEGCSAGACLFGATPASEAESISLLSIPEAHAQVNIGNKYTICIPRIENGIPVAQVENDSDWSLIPEVHAQVNINSNTNSSTGGTPVTYYADINGNLYFDSLLTRRLTTAFDCQTQVAKTFSPNDITAVNSSDQFIISSQRETDLAIFFKTWNAVLGWFNSEAGFYDYDFDTVQADAPLLSFISFPTHEFALDGSIPEQTLTITSDLGTKELCFPETERTAGEWMLYYYDVDGNPYSDFMLTEKISCGNDITNPSCGPCTGSLKDPVCCLNIEDPIL